MKESKQQAVGSRQPGQWLHFTAYYLLPTAYL